MTRRNHCLHIFSYMTITVLLLSYNSGICAEDTPKNSTNESKSIVTETAGIGNETQNSTALKPTDNTNTTNSTETTTESGDEKTTPLTEAPPTTVPTPSDPPGPPPPPSDISIFLVNDLQYDIFPVHEENGKICNVEEADKCAGGLAKLKYYMNAERNKAPHSIWLNTGNMLGGELFPVLKFDTALETMKRLDFNATTEGLNVFKYGADAGRDYLIGLNSTVITNIQPESQHKSLLFSVGSCNVSVIGFIDGTDMSENITGISIDNYTKSIVDEVDKIRKEQKDVSKLITIVIGNSNVSRARDIAKLDTVDFVFFSGANWSAETPAEKNTTSFWEHVPKANKTAYIGSVKVNHMDMAYRFVVGHVQFSINGSCIAANDTVLTVNNYYNTTNDEAALNLTKVELRNLESQNETLTKNTKNLTGEAGLCCHAECSVGNLITDAMVAALKSDSIWSKNGSRIGIFPAVHLVPNKTIPENVTLLTLNELIGEDVYIYSIALTAQQLKAVLEISINSTNSSSFNSSDFLHTSGLLQVAYYDQPVNGSRISTIKTVSETSMIFSEIDLKENSTLYNISVPLSFLKMESYKKLLGSVNASYHAVTVVEAVARYINNTEFLFLPAVGTRLMKMELPAQPPSPPPPPPPCESNTGTTIIVTLVVAALVIACSFVAWKYVIRRYRYRSGSTMHMMNLD
ncbi:protein 5NUC-like isoform X3 [Periplaneta americana]|uniref:protein 5NUC-like isoform X3 n=1 Tax=Periplaneta americana TaxID=6978 RepID=UPI0037E9933F